MSNGVYNVARAIWEDPDFANEPYTEREAWLWLVGATAFKETRARGQHGGVPIIRGEFCFSVRFLADRWQWSKSRVARFLNALLERDMIRDVSRDDEKVYSVKNYNRFQENFGKIGTPDGTTNEASVGRKRDARRDKEEPSNPVTQEDKSSLRSDSRPVAEPAPKPTSKAKPQEPEGFEAWYEEFPRKVARAAAAKAYAKARAKHDAETLIAGARRYAQSRAREDPNYTAYPATWLNGERWKDEEISHERRPERLRGNPAAGTFFDACIGDILAERRDGRADQSPPRGTVTVLPAIGHDGGTGETESEHVRVRSARRL